MTAEKDLMPNIPKLEIVKVPPCIKRKLSVIKSLNVG